ncbi:MAG: bifunctional 5,10-methylenetetrahydrofolate dehydrogenase/5,10-methenyltetrahydrofolate cyclohydrolase [Oscillospiraceae bacterium]|nr:bifunctional 5,10-methylenetetrahydrofolate dehydrogenase/5,10-methenyltetrahydrofolate cyclohydrolase [Oscillospiraceae bacterium]
MAKILYGKEAADALTARLAARAAALWEQGVVPTLALIRLGNDPSDRSYETGIRKRAEKVGVSVRGFYLPETAEKEAVLSAIDALNKDDSVHGVLLFRPLPQHLKGNEEEITSRLDPKKDVDGMTPLSKAAVFSGQSGCGFAPCTPAACMELLDYYGVDCAGKRAVVIGRSKLVGKPAAMLLLSRDATVTVCHTKTGNLAELCRGADVIVTAARSLRLLTADFVRPGQTVIDVSTVWDEAKPNAKGGLGAFAGDADFAAVEPIVDAITPVPGGVGAVTTAVLMEHVIEAAERGNCHA